MPKKMRVLTSVAIAALLPFAAPAVSSAASFEVPKECKTADFDSMTLAEMLVWTDYCRSPYKDLRAAAGAVLQEPDAERRAERILQYVKVDREELMVKLETESKKLTEKIWELMGEYPKDLYPDTYTLCELHLEKGLDAKREFVQHGVHKAVQRDRELAEEMRRQQAKFLKEQIPFARKVAEESENADLKAAVAPILHGADDPRDIMQFFAKDWPTVIAAETKRSTAELTTVHEKNLAALVAEEKAGLALIERANSIPCQDVKAALVLAARQKVDQALAQANINQKNMATAVSDAKLIHRDWQLGRFLATEALAIYTDSAEYGKIVAAADLAIADAAVQHSSQRENYQTVIDRLTALKKSLAQ